jgi:KaiC/GvpD/RAD55 family RecA-like ATPase
VGILSVVMSSYANGPEDPDDRCDYCRLRCPEEPVTLEMDGETFSFCSETCRDAMENSDRVFTEYHGHRRFKSGVSAIDRSLPQGVPRNAFVIIGGQAGTRDAALQAELVWRTIQREEPAVFVTFQNPPMAIVEHFITLGWNVQPYLESGQLRILDCFTERLGDPRRMIDRLCEWNQHLDRAADAATLTVSDPSDTDELENKLDGLLEEGSMVDTGAVVVDSLTEFGSLVQPIQAYDFVKDLRAVVCKGRFVPIFAGATYGTGEEEPFPHDLDYLVDGVVDLELNGSIVEDTLLKRIRVRKMRGVLTVPEWRAFEYTSHTGMVPFDPAAEIEKARAGRSDDGESSPSEGSEEPDVPDGEQSTGDSESAAEGVSSGTAESAEAPGEATGQPEERSTDGDRREDDRVGDSDDA